MSPDAEQLMVKPLVIGRAAMGETLSNVRLRDWIEFLRGNKPVFLDAMRFSGNLHDRLCSPHIANGAGTMALTVFASWAAEGQLSAIRQMLPDTAGARPDPR